MEEKSLTLPAQRCCTESISDQNSSIRGWKMFGIFSQVDVNVQLGHTKQPAHRGGGSRMQTSTWWIETSGGHNRGRSLNCADWPGVPERKGGRTTGSSHQSSPETVIIYSIQIREQSNVEQRCVCVCVKAPLRDFQGNNKHTRMSTCVKRHACS